MTATIHHLPTPQAILSAAALDTLRDLATVPEPKPEPPYIDQIAAARRVYAASPKRIGDWCDYLEVVEALRVRFGR